MRRALPHQSLIKKMLYSRIYGITFSIEVPPFQFVYQSDMRLACPATNRTNLGLDLCCKDLLSLTSIPGAVASEEADSSLSVERG